LDQLPSQELAKENLKQVTKYISKRFGSVAAYLLLKYVLEHKIARERNGFTVYEFAFKIAPSIVLTRKTLLKIQQLADRALPHEAEVGFEYLMANKIIIMDPETEVVDLNVPISAITDIYLKKDGNDFIETLDVMESEVILLPFSNNPAETDTSMKNSIGSVPDLLMKLSENEWGIILLKNDVLAADEL
jgi:hypothetical protein